MQDAAEIAAVRRGSEGSTARPVRWRTTSAVAARCVATAYCAKDPPLLPIGFDCLVPVATPLALNQLVTREDATAGRARSLVGEQWQDSSLVGARDAAQTEHRGPVHVQSELRAFSGLGSPSSPLGGRWRLCHRLSRHSSRSCSATLGCASLAPPSGSGTGQDVDLDFGSPTRLGEHIPIMRRKTLILIARIPLPSPPPHSPPSASAPWPHSRENDNDHHGIHHPPRHPPTTTSTTVAHAASTTSTTTRPPTHPSHPSANQSTTQPTRPKSSLCVAARDEHMTLGECVGSW